MCADERARWTAVLRDALDGEHLRSVTVVGSCASTQDLARRSPAGTVVAALRQTAGRGRLGRHWADDGGHGVSMSFVLPTGPGPPRLAVVMAVAAAAAIEQALGHAAGIKWPNDVVVSRTDRRKLAGVLIEAGDGLAAAGVGINVGHRAWPPELAGRAASLADLGAAADRLAVAASLVVQVAAALSLDDAALTAAYQHRDVLTGTTASFRAAGGVGGVGRAGGTVVTGTVIGVDPMRGLRVRTDRQEIDLPAATTTMIADPHKDPENRDVRTTL